MFIKGIRFEVGSQNIIIHWHGIEIYTISFKPLSPKSVSGSILGGSINRLERKTFNIYLGSMSYVLILISVSVLPGCRAIPTSLSAGHFMSISIVARGARDVYQPVWYCYGEESKKANRSGNSLGLRKVNKLPPLRIKGESGVPICMCIPGFSGYPIMSGGYLYVVIFLWINPAL